MKQARNLFILLRGAMVPALALGIIAFFGGNALFGSNGVLAWGEYSRKHDVRQRELARLERERAVLANRVALLNPEHADPDLADELVRRELGLAQPNEIIIPLD